MIQGQASPGRAGQVALLPQHPGRGPVDQLGRHPAVPDRADQRGAVAGDAGQLDVQARFQGQRGGLAGRGGHRVLGLQERDRVVVRDDQAVETELVAQQPGQQLAVGRHRDPVDVGVGRHHRPRPAAGAPSRTAPGSRRRTRAGRWPPGPGCGPPGRPSTRRMLQRGLDPGRLQAPHVRRADRADQVGVLADGLLGPAPARVPGHVEDRRQALVDAAARMLAPMAAAISPTSPGRRTRPRPAASGRWWPSRRRSRSGTPRARRPGCRTGSPRRPAPAARAACGRRRRAAPAGCRTPG